MLPTLLALLVLADPGRLQEEVPPTVEVRVPREPVDDERWEGTLAEAVDGQDFAETPGYRRLLEIIGQMGEDELRQGAEQQLNIAEALAQPDAWRGKIVRLHGLVAWMQAVKLESPLGESEDVYRALVTQPDGTAGVAVDFLHPPPELGIQRDVIEVEGVFLRTVRYENKGGTHVEAPYLIARGLRRLDVDALRRSTALGGLGKILIAAAVIFLVMRVLLLVRRRRAGERRPQGGRPLRERSRTPRRNTHPTREP
jgi:hypothetical protein